MANNPEIGNAVSVVFGDLRAEILYLPIYSEHTVGPRRQAAEPFHTNNHQVQAEFRRNWA
jgi:hypothetical protein